MSDDIFVDSWFFIATLVQRDPWAQRATQLAREVAARSLVTTDEVLVEVLGFCSEGGAAVRASGVRLVSRLLAGEGVRVESQSRESLLAGLDLYGQRPDKGYSLVDCISMVTMRRLGITEVLTGDRHFAQEGFVTLF